MQGDSILALSNEGELMLIRINPEGSDILERRTISDAETWVRVLLGRDTPPRACNTNDLDFLLRPEIVTSSDTMATIREALDRTGFEAIESAKYYQFSEVFGRRSRSQDRLPSRPARKIQRSKTRQHRLPSRKAETKRQAPRAQRRRSRRLRSRASRRSGSRSSIQSRAL